MRWIGLSSGSVVNNLPAVQETQEIHGNPLQYSYLENLIDKRSLAGYSPWCCKESDTTELNEHTTHEISHQVACKHSSGLILRLLLRAPECTGLPHLTDKEYFQTMHNSKEYHSLSSPDSTVLSHRAWLPMQKGFKSLTSSQPVTISFSEVPEKWSPVTLSFLLLHLWEERHRILYHKATEGTNKNIHVNTIMWKRKKKRLVQNPRWHH